MHSHNNDQKAKANNHTNYLIEPNNRMQIMNEINSQWEKNVALRFVSHFIPLEVCNPFFFINIHYLSSVISSLIHSVFLRFSVSQKQIQFWFHACKSERDRTTRCRDSVHIAICIVYWSKELITPIAISQWKDTAK